MPRYTDHQQVTIPMMIPVERQAAKIVDVDEKMAPLLQMMWEHNITTNFSCQGDTDLFVDQECYEASRFLAYVQMRRDAWSIYFVGALLHDVEMVAADKVSLQVEFDEYPQTKEQRITLRFPTSYIERIITIMEGWN